MPPPSILIVGCGIAGPVLATCLLSSPAVKQHPQSAPRITIVERSATATACSYGQNIDIRGAGATIIRKLGLETAIRAATTGEEGVRFVDERDRVVAAFAADKTGQVQTGTSDIEIMRGSLANICYRQSLAVSEQVHSRGGPRTDYMFDETLSGLEQHADQVHVTFAKSGETRAFDLVVGADGLLSSTRRMAFGGPEDDETRLKRLGMYGAFFSMPKGDTDSLWRRWFHAPGRRAIMVRPSEARDRSTVFMYVINDQDKRLPECAATGRKAVEQQKAVLDDYFRDAGWESPRVISEMHAAHDFYYSMVAQIKMDQWSNGRVVLLGDSGYCPSPISGMGTTLALVGAYNLAGALVQHPTDHTAAFAQYQEIMRPVVDKAQKLFPGFPHLNNPDTAWGIQVMHTLFRGIAWSKALANGVFMLVGPSAGQVPVEDYGFQDLDELKPENAGDLR